IEELSLSSYSCIQVYNYAHIPPFAFVYNVISLWAIELIHEQVNKPSDYECDCVISSTHGIPCNCVLQGMEENGLDALPRTWVLALHGVP
ncbi:hypothetical protein LINGRAHAP2_LOCUS19873, partial [Linum grandiflorum]